jgi:hypothetical protein
MGAKWFGRVGRLAIVASAVACNGILGIQDLSPGAPSPTTPQPFDGGASFGKCTGHTYLAETGSACSCGGAGYFALCDMGTYSQCSCDVPPGYTPGTVVVPRDGGTGGDATGIEDFTEFDATGFQDFNEFDATGFQDSTDFDATGVEDSFFTEDATGVEDAFLEDAADLDVIPPPPPPPPIDAGR